MRRASISLPAAIAAMLTPVGMAVAQTSAPVQVPVVGQVALPHDLSPWGMFLGADVVVKGVLIGLAFASVVTWTVALAKLSEIWLARRRAHRQLRALLNAPDMASAIATLERERGVIPAMAAAARDEIVRSGTTGADGIKERIALRFQRMESAEGRRVVAGTNVLATIGATGPFVGLFGTVWGIMNSFIGISKAHTTNLAVVAPGIAEALLATAIGLVAAIPAVVAYNLISRASGGYRAIVGDAAAEILRTVGRDLDRHAAESPSGSTRGRSALAAE